MNIADGNAGARTLGGAVRVLLAAPVTAAAALAGTLVARGSQICEIPPPCWEPQPVDACTLALAPGSTSRIQVHVWNCTWSRRVIGITAAGKLAGLLNFAPTKLFVAPQERETFKILVRVPDEAKHGQTFSGTLLVRGCLDHFARIAVSVAECASPICCDIEVKDCPDQIHHWYDHFYCPRPCREVRDPDEQNG